MAKTYSCILVGVDVHTIEIETVLGSGFSGLNILGLPTDITRDMRERVRSALETIGLPIPARRVVVNVGPNEWIKLSRTNLSQLDFAIAASIIRALYENNPEVAQLFLPEKEFLAGELSLSGELKSIGNPLIYEAIFDFEKNGSTICLPYSNKISHINIEYFNNLMDWITTRKLQLKENYQKINVSNIPDNQNQMCTSKNKIPLAMDALKILLKNPKLAVSVLVAVAGRHNIIIAGEPGLGKSFAIKKLPFFMNSLKDSEKIEVKLIHSTADVNDRPFRSPHHSATAAALVGGSNLKPGEVTLAHRGVLFLDELAEFPRSSLEALREPLDSQCVTISRANGQILYPAQFLLCATANPCPCGYMFSRKKPCRCRPRESQKYLQKISGPLLDRFCLQIWLDSSEIENECDIFSSFLTSIHNSNDLENFIGHFFNVQEKISTSQDKPVHSIYRESFSLRGNEKISRILLTFEQLFPSLIGHKKFQESVLSYRILMDLFNKPYSM